MKVVNHQLAELALERASGTAFEQFAQAFFASLVGQSFVPLGGHHDGGADAFQHESIFQSAHVNTFYQFSIEKQPRSKIRRTATRLREFGRNVRSIVYCTSAIVQHPDQEEEVLSEELGINIRIRDQKYISSHINDSDQTVAAFNSYLSPALSYLKDIGGTSYISHSPNLPIRSLCVFLGQEVERRRGNTELLEAVTDSLILWALDDTDPDKNILRSRKEILDRIIQALPAAKQFIRSTIDARLSALSAKKNTNGREIWSAP